MSDGSRLVAYVRVSTIEQAAEGVSLDMQTRAIHAYAEAMGYTISKVYREEGVGAGSLDRPMLQEAVRDALRPSADGLVVLKLDRLVRSVTGLAELMDRFNAEGKSLVFVRDNLDTSTASGRLVANVMASVAQWERETIGERTKEALAELKRQGVRLGRPPSEDVPEWKADLIRRDYANQSQRDLARMHGVKVSTVRRLVATS